MNSGSLIPSPWSDETAPFQSVFWKVAGLLVGVQVVTGAIGVGLSSWLAYRRSLDLVTDTIRLRLDSAAEEVEQRMMRDDPRELRLSPTLYFDLSRRFADPIYVLDADGAVVQRVERSVSISPPFPLGDFGERGTVSATVIPDSVRAVLERGRVVVRLSSELDRTEQFALAPLYRMDGRLAGGLLVRPLSGTVTRAMESTREGFERALLLVVLIAGVSAIVLGGLCTWVLIRPLRRMTRTVERIGSGEYGERVTWEGTDEFGRLASSINRMADRVEESVDTLRNTDRLRRELLSNIGHDLRTPLAAMLGYLEEAEDRLSAGRRAEARQAIRTAGRQGTYLARLTEDIFELSRLVSGPPAIRREPVPVAELIDDALDSVRSAFEEAGVELEVDYEDPLPIVRADGARLLRVLNNLLTNACRHSPTGESVTVRAGLDGTDLRIEVRDSGPGMSSEDEERVFDRYYRGDDERSREQANTGLGLAISKAIVEAHDGTITVDSVSGEGSSFVVIIPTESPARPHTDSEDVAGGQE